MLSGRMDVKRSPETECSVMVCGSYTMVLVEKGDGEYEVSYEICKQNDSETENPKHVKTEQETSRCEDSSVDLPDFPHDLNGASVAVDQTGNNNHDSTKFTNAIIHSPAEEVLQKGPKYLDGDLENGVENLNDSINTAVGHQWGDIQVKEHPDEDGMELKCEVEHCSGEFSTEKVALQHEHDEKVHRSQGRSSTEVAKSCKKPSRKTRSKTSTKQPLTSTLKLFQFNCMDCSERYLVKVSRKEPFLDEYLQEGVKIRCSACGHIGVSSAFSAAAEEEKSDLASPMYMCSHQGDPSCGMSLFRRVESLSQHRQHHHSLKTVNINMINVEEESKHEAKAGNKRVRRPWVMPEDDSSFMCDHELCTKVFKLAEQLKAHKKCHKEGGKGCPCSGCAKQPVKSCFTVLCGNCNVIHRARMRRGNPFVSRGLDIHCRACGKVTKSAQVLQGKKQFALASENDVKFLCPESGCTSVPFKFIHELIAHMKYHSTAVVNCKHCLQPVRKKTAMRSHLTTCPKLANPSKCFVCGKLHHNEFHLSEHMRRTHKRKELLCVLCGEKFPNYAKYHSHKKKHASGEMDLVCQICGEELPDREKWRSHRQKMHPDTIPEKKWICELCGNGFTTTRLLNQHRVRSHREKDIECKVCHMRFRYKRQLDMHTLTHDPSKRTAQCHMCPKTFRANNDLKEHIHREHGGKRDQCPHCAKQFKSKQGFNLHMRKVHPGKPKTIENCSMAEKIETPCEIDENLQTIEIHVLEDGIQPQHAQVGMVEEIETHGDIQTEVGLFEEIEGEMDHENSGINVEMVEQGMQGDIEEEIVMNIEHVEVVELI